MGNSNGLLLDRSFYEIWIDIRGIVEQRNSMFNLSFYCLINTIWRSDVWVLCKTKFGLEKPSCSGSRVSGRGGFI